MQFTCRLTDEWCVGNTFEPAHDGYCMVVDDQNIQFAARKYASLLQDRNLVDGGEVAITILDETGRYHSICTNIDHK